MVEPFRQSFMQETYIYFNPISSYVIVQNNCSYYERLSMQSKSSQISLAPNMREWSFNKASKNVHLRYNLTDWLQMPGSVLIRLLSKQRQKQSSFNSEYSCPTAIRAHSAPLYPIAKFNYSLIWYSGRMVVHYFVSFQRRLSSPDVFEFPEKLT